MQWVQFIERNIYEANANFLNFPILFQDNGGMDAEETFEEKYEKKMVKLFS